MALLPLLIFALWGCEDEDDLLGSRPAFIGDDPYNDLAALGERLYVTNYDWNEGSGDRVYLYSFDLQGQPVASFNLQMNSQGYISLSADSAYLYLLSQSGLISKVTPTGDLVNRILLSGAVVAHQPGALVALPGGSQYALLWDEDGTVYVHPFDGQALTLGEAQDTILVPGRTDFRAACVPSEADTIHVLSSDSTGADYLVHFDLGWNVLGETALADSAVAGVACLGNEIWVSTDDRRIVPLSDL
ncbi:MAG: hypothetical protein C4524_10850 [Candidatus Zixiibacteriota bacterium]|nr:MAG: hypothetical protein C4524_10850 [candidate division Zixibacteria bacterium]